MFFFSLNNEENNKAGVLVFVNSNKIKEINTLKSWDLAYAMWVMQVK